MAKRAIVGRDRYFYSLEKILVANNDLRAAALQDGAQVGPQPLADAPLTLLSSIVPSASAGSTQTPAPDAPANCRPKTPAESVPMRSNKKDVLFVARLIGFVHNQCKHFEPDSRTGLFFDMVDTSSGDEHNTLCHCCAQVIQIRESASLGDTHESKW